MAKEESVQRCQLTIFQCKELYIYKVITSSDLHTELISKLICTWPGTLIRTI